MRLRRVLDFRKALADVIQHALGRLGVGVGHDHGELFTAVATNMVGLAQALLEKQRQALDHPIAHGVAVGVVDLLEKIDVDHRKAQRLAVAFGTKARVFEQLQGVGVVVQAGQAVAHHACLEAACTGGAVAHGGDQVAWFDRFGEEVIAAFAHGVELLVQVIFGGQVDDRHADITVIVADHLGQFRAVALGHVHVEDDQVGLEVGQLAHCLNRLDQGAGNDACAVEHALGVCDLRPRVVDDQYLVGFVLRDMRQHLDAFEQVRGVQAAGEELLATGAYSLEARQSVGVFSAEEQQRNLMLEAFLHALRKL